MLYNSLILCNALKNGATILIQFTCFTWLDHYVDPALGRIRYLRNREPKLGNYSHRWIHNANDRVDYNQCSWDQQRVCPMELGTICFALTPVTQVMNIHRERGYWDDMGLVSWVGSWGEEEFFG